MRSAQQQPVAAVELGWAGMDAETKSQALNALAKLEQGGQLSPEEAQAVLAAGGNSPTLRKKVEGNLLQGPAAAGFEPFRKYHAEEAFGALDAAANNFNAAQPHISAESNLGDEAAKIFRTPAKRSKHFSTNCSNEKTNATSRRRRRVSAATVNAKPSLGEPC